MTTASEVVRQAQQDTAAVAERLRGHPYVRRLEAGQLSREQLARFAGEQWHIIGSDLRSVAFLVARFGGTDPFFLEVLAGERAALEALRAFARALGLGDDHLRAYEPLAGAHAYTCYMAWLALYASAAEVAAAYLVNFPAWGENCGRISRALRERYGMQAEDTAFFDLFASPAPGFEAAAMRVIEAGLREGVQPALIRRAVRLLQAYELMYWDTLLEASGA